MSSSLDTNKIKLHFNRSADKYNKASFLQKKIADDFIARLDLLKIKPRRILELGAGSGYLTKLLHQKFPKSEIFALDFAIKMLQVLDARGINNNQNNLRLIKLFSNIFFRKGKIFLINANIEKLPFKDASFDLIVSNLAIQWLVNQEQAFSEIKRVANKNTVFNFTTFGLETLKELKFALHKLEPNIARVNNFLDLKELGNNLMHSGMQEIVTDSYPITVTYKTPFKLLKDLQILGASNARKDIKPLKKSDLLHLQDIYLRDEKTGLYHATYEVINAHSWINIKTKMAKNNKNVNKQFISLDEISRRQ